jgi:sugar/nucleoside kinase (ribokinase family)
LDLVGLGVCTLDLLMRVPEFPAADSVQRSSATRLQGGGPVATALAAAAKFGAKTAMIDRHGDDWRGEQIRSELTALGVNLSACLVDSGADSALASVWVRERDGARTIAYDPGTTEPVQAEDLPAGLIESARIFHSNGRHDAAWPEAVRRARTAGTLVSFDGGAHRFRPECREMISMVDVAIVSMDWAHRFSGHADPILSGEAIQARGPELVVITAGSAGSWVLAGAERFHQPAFTVPNTIDTTGCGDVYHGVFLTGWAWGWSALRCARYASAAAAMKSQALGGRGVLPDRAAVESFLRDHDRALQTAQTSQG